MVSNVKTDKENEEKLELELKPLYKYSSILIDPNIFIAITENI